MNTTSAINEIEKFYNYIYKNSSQNTRLERKFNKFNEIFLATTNSDISKKSREPRNLGCTLHD